MIAVFPPTVIDHVPYDSQLVYEETLRIGNFTARRFL